jgi:hypothetical protein
MLFYFTDEIVSAAEKNNVKAIEIIENVANASRYGKHFLFGSRNVLQRLITIPFYENNKTKNVFIYYLSKYATFGDIVNQVSLKIIFNNNSEVEINKDEFGRYREVHIPIDKISDYEIFGSTVLLGENQAEINFYFFFCEYYKRFKKLQIKNNFKPGHGGGDTLATIIESIQASKSKFCLALVDSDKRCPNYKIGATLKKVLKLREREGAVFNCDFIYSDLFREAENLIPIEILRKTVVNNPDWTRGFSIIDQVVENNGCIRYFDIKEGLSIKKYQKIDNKDYRSYVDEIILKSDTLKEVDLQHIQCGDIEDGIILHGLGSNVLARSVDCLMRDFDNLIFEDILKLELKDEWERIGKEVFNWTCASDAIRV